MPTHKPTTPPRTRSKAEELALRRAQLERRAARQRPASAELVVDDGLRRAETMRATADDALDALDASAAAQRTASYEEAEHAAKEQARVEKQARASAERRSNEMGKIVILSRFACCPSR